MNSSIGRRSIKPAPPVFTVSVSKLKSDDESEFSSSTSQISEEELKLPHHLQTTEGGHRIEEGDTLPSTESVPASVVPALAVSPSAVSPSVAPASVAPTPVVPPTPAVPALVVAPTPVASFSEERRPRKVKYTHTPEGRDLKKKIAALVNRFEGHPKFVLPTDKMTLATAEEYYEELQIESDRLNSQLESKFCILQQNNSNFEIKCPPTTIRYKEREKIYEEYVKNIIARYNAEDYKMIMYIIMIVLELVASKIFKIPATGFARMQMQNAQRYQKLLIQLGRVEDASDAEPSSPIGKLLLIGFLQFGGLVAVNLLAKELGQAKIASVFGDAVGKIGDYFAGEGGIGLSRDSDGLPTAPTRGSGMFDGYENWINGGMKLVDMFTGGGGDEEKEEIKRPVSRGAPPTL